MPRARWSGESWTPDGTHAPAPLPLWPDPLAGLVTADVPPEPAAPVVLPVITLPAPQAVPGLVHRPARARHRPAHQREPQVVAPAASVVEEKPPSRSGGWLLALLVLAAVLFGVFHDTIAELVEILR
ncbi:hypothetical protein [Umezawaea beigongshangensis]|uniref:hypothetical protein n=1 Tax=Umezawaea beigongshangensis TaxID=2780383 RepID=UPI0018F220F8|nr:hypothetical protein [Umezawaea beigongshangensis]